MIDTAQPSDGPAILKLSQETAVFNSTEVHCVEEIWQEYQDKGMEGSGYEVLVFREGNRVLGFACFGPHPLTAGTFDLYWIAVHPAAQGRGIGFALLHAVEESVLRRGGRKLVIETSSTPPYAPARRLYERAGYALEAILHDFYSEGDHLVIYSKMLRMSTTSPMPIVNASIASPRM